MFYLRRIFPFRHHKLNPSKQRPVKIVFHVALDEDEKDYIDGFLQNLIHPIHGQGVHYREESKTMSSDIEMEKKIQAKGLNAPRLNPQIIENKIKSKQFHVFEGSQLTVCCLTLLNGFTVTGESACASPENFDKEIGEEISFKNAKDKIWALEGYLLKQNLYIGEQ